MCMYVYVIHSSAVPRQHPSLPVVPYCRDRVPVAAVHHTTGSGPQG